MTTMSDGDLQLKTGEGTLLPRGFLVGHAQDEAGGTGCTAVICEAGAVAAVSVRGAAPATLETDLLEPSNTVQQINAVLLSGGSAFGLEAASGAMQWLAKRGAGFSVGDAVVPIVCGASIFDLGVGRGDVYPDKAMGFAACEAAQTSVRVGNVGVGTGASVGKLLGGNLSMKSGFGAASLQFGELIVTAVVGLNAVGNVFDRMSATTIAGVINPQDGSLLLDAYDAFMMMAATSGNEPGFPANTTIGCVLTNGTLTKAQAAHVADMAHDGYARAIEPVHTGFDGDTVFVMSSGDFPGSPEVIGVLAARVMEAAIHDAALSASGAYGLLAARGFSENLT